MLSRLFCVSWTQVTALMPRVSARGFILFTLMPSEAVDGESKSDRQTESEISGRSQVSAWRRWWRDLWASDDVPWDSGDMLLALSVGSDLLELLWTALRAGVSARDASGHVTSWSAPATPSDQS